MILAFGVFTLLVIVLLWMFQTLWLDDIYRSLKLKELDRCADAAVSLTLSADDAEAYDEELGEIAKKYEVCLSVYRISGVSATQEMRKHVNSFCYIHNMNSNDTLNQLYWSAEENGGAYTELVSLNALFGRNRGGREETSDEGENMISVRLVSDGSSTLMLLFNTELVPLKSTVKTLNAQLGWITAILSVIGVVLALILSDRISKPVRQMSGEASKLAMGDYNVNFDGKGCSETENLSATLNRAAYELARLDKMQKDLIANVSHDLRTPLTMIAGYTEIMRDIPGEASPENFQIVLDETDRLKNLVTDMLEVSKYQNGSQKLNAFPFNFTAVIRKTLERYQKLKEHEGYEIRFEADRDVWVNGDEGRLLQVVYNLINNAVNYTGDDKTVVIRQTVEPAKDGGEEEVLVEVIDTGDGISEEDLPLVWERYYKAHDFHKRANMGTGLGLSIVRSILTLHGAGFGVKSKVGQGSNFWFRLKTVPPVTETKAAPL
jgi:signal transduction histidine kinase